MDKALDRAAALAAAEPFIDCGCAVRWLRPRDKMPIAREWSTAPVHTPETLAAEYRDGANLGIRLGEPSKTPGGYLHIIDLDVRKEKLAPEAWAALLAIWPEARSFPMVISGSGGESRHIHLICDKPFAGRKLAVSDGFEMVFDKRKGREVRKRHWEIDFLGTGKQAVLPPSIHPDTGEAYAWAQGAAPDLDMLDMGIGPLIGSEVVESWGLRVDDPGAEDDDDLEALVAKAPMGLSLEEVETHLRKLPGQWVEDRDLWLQAGMAVHHETGGSQEGFELWIAWSEASGKFDPKDARRVWQSFRDRTRKPTRMATVIQAARRRQLALAHTPPEDDDLSDILGPSLPSAPRAASVSGPEADWVDHLAATGTGAVKSNLPNITAIIRNDPRTCGIIGYNEFVERICITGKPGVKRCADAGARPVQLTGKHWTMRDPQIGEPWTDDHDNQVRCALEASQAAGGYGIKVSDRDLVAAVNIVGRENTWHPVKTVIESVGWDGRHRIETLFIDFLGCEDTTYYRDISRLFLLGAVTRIYEPGHKFDFAPILEGAQGIRKSTFVKILGLARFHGNLVGNFENLPEMVNKMLGHWIMEIPELHGFSKHDSDIVKGFISYEKDNVRLPYEKRTRDYSRQCVFIGTTNNSEYLRDETGNRRYWPVKVANREIDTAKLSREMPQIWAEALHVYRGMRKAQPGGDLPLHITNAMTAEAALMMQESVRIESVEEGMAGVIQEWLEKPIDNAPEYDDLETPLVEVMRDRTCLKQIWLDCFGRDISQMTQQQSNQLGRAMAHVQGWEKAATTVRFPGLGPQKHYRRVGYARLP